MAIHPVGRNNDSSAKMGAPKHNCKEEEMLGIAWSDVIGVFESIKWYLVVFAVIVIVAMIVAIAVRKIDAPLRKLIRANAIVVPVIALVAVVSMILTGPMSTLLNLSTTTAKNAKVSAATTAKASSLARTIAGEGFVLLKNDDNLLPLANTSKLNLFGWASENPVYGGTGSGAINANYQIESLTDGLHKAGFKTNDELTNLYKKMGSRDSSNGTFNKGWSLPEATKSQYSDKVINDAKRFSDTAVITLARVGGEGYNDMPTDMSKVAYNNNSKDYPDFKPGESYLQPSQTEKDMIDTVCSNFDKVIFLYNGSNPMELGFLNQYRQIKSALWVPAPGNVGFDSLGKIFKGEINPSGRTTDTFLYDMRKAPWYNNAAATKYTNMQNMALHLPVAKGVYFDLAPSFTNYVEDIYVGYKYYETAASEGAIDYDSTVQFPFGYGLSYTKFSQHMGDITKDGKNLAFDVTVKNTGAVAGKDTVEVYSNPPYTNGGIEKASANLIVLKKTKDLKPGESQTINITFPIEQLASYDDKEAKSYILEKGNYQIAIKSDSHTVLGSRDYTVGDSITYGKNNPRTSDKIAATNKIAEIAGDVTYLSRRDHFANFAAATAAPSSDVLAQKYVAQYHVNKNFNPRTYDDKNATMPVTNAKNNIKLKDLRGAKADDPRWGKLLDEMSVDDMSKLTSLAGFQTPAIDSIGKVATTDVDGPAAINNNFTKQGSIGFPIAVVLANTWNTELAHQFGEVMGQMAREMGIVGWYAPAMNTHRTAIGGRNFEYYSEDGQLAGAISSNVVSGAKDKGVYAYIKHFALYDSNAMMVSVWSTEQAAREVYLRPFEMSVKDGKADATMVAWSFLGPKWSGEQGWVNTIMRDEWGFNGMALTDSFGEDGRGFMNADNALPNGVDAMLSTYGNGPNVVNDKSNPSSVMHLRNASKHILYATVNSGAYDADSVAVKTPMWKTMLFIVNIIAAVLIIGAEIVIVRKYLKRRNDIPGQQEQH
ncbi:MAG: glycoside hydrolase family 3 C-terminal domain-containing protein [Bifidobacterium tibiigranuli]|jgi:beta-glucosidase|nr:glycoside hydrolase family 3 C-terminal domain-containing protein [Bifidobacterium tibiigranuli]MCI1798204.1 glycoside hydrolase family 3 C-terminal domain-containing protein [Bifidobacterium tibiigranuli]